LDIPYILNSYKAGIKMKGKRAVLKKGKDVPIRNFHHWIFSGAIDYIDEYENGEILTVQSNSKDILGHAYFNKTTDIAGRMMNFDNSDPVASLKKNIINSIKLREEIFKLDGAYCKNNGETNCFRLINGESDAVPGLIVDKYNDVLVVQIASIGMEKLKGFVLEELKDFYKGSIKTIYERSDMSSRKREGLKPSFGFLYTKEDKKEAKDNTKVEVLEHGIKFLVDFVNGQKTGLFLDMREMRSLIGNLSLDKNILNCFCYTGAFSLHALKGGARSVTSIDISKPALELAETNFELNNFGAHLAENNETLNLKNQIINKDVFSFLREQELNYDVIILDPPAFAKKKKDLDNAKKAYYEINHTTFSKMPKGSILLTCSCSYHIDALSFERIIAKAAKDAGRKIKLISKHRLAFDHPINLYHQDFDYLKSLVLYVD
jgi:23S rRNA (cytosine1962-C5)-methyltransferase